MISVSFLLRRILKYGLLASLIVITIIFFYLQPPFPLIIEYGETEDDSPLPSFPFIDRTKSMIRKNFSLCLEKEEGRFHTIEAFSRLMTALEVEVSVIEPILLYCLLSNDEKDLLKRRRFNITEWYGLPNVANFAVVGINNTKLDSAESRRIIQSVGFELLQVRSEVPAWVVQGYTGKKLTNVTHHFFRMRDNLVHVVAFFERGNYLWHKGLTNLKNNELFAIPREGLLFSSKDSAYERFYASTLEDENYAADFLIPSNPSHFLSQMPTSEFLECDSSRSSSISARHAGRKYNKTKKTFLVSLNELKAKLQPMLITFLVFAGTLLGWYRECDIIAYTTDVDYAAWAADIGEDKFWLEQFQNNSLLNLLEIMGLPEEAFELNLKSRGVRVDLFFLYEKGTNVWAPGHRPSQGYYFSYNYPNFTVCAADLLGNKIQVPCIPEEVIVAEYGRQWRMPVTRWHYEKSPKNMGPRIYWPKEKRQKAFREFS